MADIEKEQYGVSPMYAHVGSGQYEEKLGAKFCGCCCDMRRATVILSILLLSLGLMNLVVLLGAESLRQTTRDTFDDDVLLETLNKSYVTSAILVGIGVISNGCSIVGALHYNTKLVGINIAWMVITYFSNIIIEILTINSLEEDFNTFIPYPFLSWFFAGLATFFLLYPMAIFIREVNSGIMSRETYRREEYSCCCTPRRY